MLAPSRRSSVGYLTGRGWCTVPLYHCPGTCPIVPMKQSSVPEGGWVAARLKRQPSPAYRTGRAYRRKRAPSLFARSQTLSSRLVPLSPYRRGAGDRGPQPAGNRPRQLSQKGLGNPALAALHFQPCVESRATPPPETRCCCCGYLDGCCCDRRTGRSSDCCSTTRHATPGFRQPVPLLGEVTLPLHCP